MRPIEEILKANAKELTDEEFAAAQEYVMSIMNFEVCKVKGLSKDGKLIVETDEEATRKEKLELVKRIRRC